MFGQQKRGKNPKVSRFQADTTVTKQRCWVVFQEDMGRTGEHVTCLSLLNLFELWERERRVTSYRCRGYGDEMKVVREECKERRKRRKRRRKKRKGGRGWRKNG